MKDQNDGTTVYVAGSVTVRNHLYLVLNKLMGIVSIGQLKMVAMLLNAMHGQVQNS